MRMPSKRDAALRIAVLTTGAVFIMSLPWTWLTRQIPPIAGVIPVSFVLAALFILPAGIYGARDWR